MPTAIVLGAGMVGSVMAADLAGDPQFDATLADLRPEPLRRAEARSDGRLTTVQVDLSVPEKVTATVEGFDIVLGALPSTMGFRTLEAVIDAGKNCCDISFMAEDALALDRLARDRGVTAVVDCGVAPGLSNLIAGDAVARLDECRMIEIHVGGVPRDPRWPFYYKAAFSPHDVLEEYTRPARIVEAGRVVVREPLGDREQVEFAGVGTLEAFITDGLRSLIRTLKVPCMKEKTLRWPGHAELMRAFRETGLFSRDPVEVGGSTVRPLDVTSTLMFPKWTYEEGEEDLTVMRVVADGTKDGVRIRLTWEMVDSFETSSGTSSMARTTAFPCTIVARRIACGAIERPGVIPPEVIGQQGHLPEILQALAARGVRVEARSEPLDK